MLSIFIKIKTGVEIYQIFYATPHPTGLEKLKESIWDVFDGDRFHRNSSIAEGQGVLWDLDTAKEINAKDFSKEAQELILKQFSEKTVTFNEISNFILEETMLRSGQIIDYVLKPLIKENKIVKGNKGNKQNYKNDTFKFVKE